MSHKRIIEQNMFYPETQNTFCDKKNKKELIDACTFLDVSLIKLVK